MGHFTVWATWEARVNTDQLVKSWERPGPALVLITSFEVTGFLRKTIKKKPLFLPNIFSGQTPTSTGFYKLKHIDWKIINLKQ